MRSWNGLGVTKTIYEEEQEDGSRCSSPASSSASRTHPSSSSSLFASLRQTVDEWSRTTGSTADVLVHVYDRSFRLHKGPLVSQSRYLRRHVAESAPSVVDLSPPSTITPETFAAVASFCYGADMTITPDNVATLRVAAEWLEMSDDDDPNHDGDGSLLERTEWYFCQTVASSVEHAVAVLRTCLALIPGAAESAAFLAGRCIEALSVAGVGGPETGTPHWFDDLSTLTAKEFQMIADAIQHRLEHDLVYNIVDRYLEKHSEENKLTEEEKNRICSVVNCKKLSPSTVVHLVRNPRMPLRFVVQTMLVEQLHTRVSFYDHVCKAHAASTPDAMGTVTIGDVLQRDAALRQARHLRATMEATYLRIQMLERELSGMRRTLREEGKRVSEGGKESLRVRSESCRLILEREEEGEEEERVMVQKGRGSKSGRWFGSRLAEGVRSVLTAMRSESRSTSCSGDGDVVATSASAKESNKRARHRRNRSVS